MKKHPQKKLKQILTIEEQLKTDPTACIPFEFNIV